MQRARHYQNDEDVEDVGESIQDDIDEDEPRTFKYKAETSARTGDTFNSRPRVLNASEPDSFTSMNQRISGKRVIPKRNNYKSYDGDSSPIKVTAGEIPVATVKSPEAYDNHLSPEISGSKARQKERETLKITKENAKEKGKNGTDMKESEAKSISKSRANQVFTDNVSPANLRGVPKDVPKEMKRSTRMSSESEEDTPNLPEGSDDDSGYYVKSISIPKLNGGLVSFKTKTPPASNCRPKGGRAVATPEVTQSFHRADKTWSFEQHGAVEDENWEEEIVL